MADEEAPEIQDQPDAEVQDEPQSEDSFTESYDPDQLPEEARSAYDDAYKRLQADYTRKRQADSQRVRELEDAITTLSERLATEDEDDYDEWDDDSDEYVDPDDRIARLEAYIQQQEQQRQAATQEEAETECIGQQLEDIAERENVDFSDEELEFIYDLTQTPRFRADDGTPLVDEAFQALSDFQRNARKKYVESKEAPTIPSGRPGEESFDLESKEGRQDYFAALVQAEQEADQG